jgi:NAD(P)-dependent dehydrogenase (short-subunit alcohol dehydrogenase family)
VSYSFPQDEAFTKIITLNLQRVFNLTQKCLPLLRAAAKAGGREGRSYRDPARIINVRYHNTLSYNNSYELESLDWLY